MTHLGFLMTPQSSRALCHIFTGRGLRGRDACRALVVRILKVMNVCLTKHGNRVWMQTQMLSIIKLAAKQFFDAHGLAHQRKGQWCVERWRWWIGSGLGWEDCFKTNWWLIYQNWLKKKVFVVSIAFLLYRLHIYIYIHNIYLMNHHSLNNGF